MLRFTIRDCLWLMVMVALGVGWWVERGREVAATAQLADLRVENAHLRQFIDLRYDRVELTKWGWEYKERENPSTETGP